MGDDPLDAADVEEAAPRRSVDVSAMLADTFVL
jgi:hypothetical protein